MSASPSPEPATSATLHRERFRRWARWRLRVLLVIQALLLVLYFASQIDPAVVKRYMPGAEGFYDWYNSPAVPSTSAAGARLVAEVAALGGQARRTEKQLGFLGLFGGTERFSVDFRGPQVDEAALARFVRRHGDQVTWFALVNTSVTDDGLPHLEGMTHLRHLVLGNANWRDRVRQQPPTRFTDAGLLHLRGLTSLQSLNLEGLPVTDAGLDALKDLPGLGALYLQKTAVTGPGLGRLKALPQLIILYLDQSEMTDEGLTHLAGAANLQVLGLDGLPISPEGLKALEPLPKLKTLSLRGCGLLDEDLDDFRKNRPDVKIER